MGNVTGKVWGSTSVIIQTPLVELHKINIKAGYKCSEHKHEHKWNGFYLISGTLEIHVRKNNYDLTDVTVLRAGGFTTVRPGEYHWFSSITDCVALELYYPETLSEDIVRKSVGGPDISAPYEATRPADNVYPDAYEKSPCTKICKINPVTNRCVGCGRTIEDIQNYGLNHKPEGYDK